MVIAHGFLTLLKRLVGIRLYEMLALLSGFPRAQGRLPQVGCINQNQHNQTPQSHMRSVRATDFIRKAGALWSGTNRSTMTRPSMFTGIKK
jgi:hypothetical protein